jgi:hypothetical protein
MRNLSLAEGMSPRSCRGDRDCALAQHVCVCVYVCVCVCVWMDGKKERDAHAYTHIHMTAFIMWEALTPRN